MAGRAAAGLPFQTPARLADGLGLESDHGLGKESVRPAPATTHPGALSREIGSPASGPRRTGLKLHGAK